MEKLPVGKEDLAKYHDDVEIVRKTAKQVIKDFAEFGIDISFPTNLKFAYNQLFDELSPIIQEIIDKDMSRLYSLLYRIDIHESTVRKGTHEMNKLELHDVITHLILERELKKVLTRLHFSQNS
ncbi:MAG: hypothetical protein JW894_03320 [Bacteroidales bacterium]|nr:hypothetical protein [Bacteroidales bacterium]